MKPTIPSRDEATEGSGKERGETKKYGIGVKAGSSKIRNETEASRVGTSKN
jgi:hypothetical protein